MRYFQPNPQPDGEAEPTPTDASARAATNPLPAAAPGEQARGPRGSWRSFASGLAVILAGTAVVVLVIMNSGPKQKAPLPNPVSDGTNDPPKPTSLPPNPPQPARTDPDGKAAEWVLSIGGGVRVKTAAGVKGTSTPGTLPAEPFTVYGVYLQGSGDKVTDAEFEHFKAR